MLSSLSKGYTSISLDTFTSLAKTRSLLLQLYWDLDFREMWIGFISWAWTNLFIRRRLNPEVGRHAYRK